MKIGLKNLLYGIEVRFLFRNSFVIVKLKMMIFTKEFFNGRNIKPIDLTLKPKRFLNCSVAQLWKFKLIVK